MNVLVLVPFKEQHMQRIREAAGADATVVQMSEYRTGKSVSKVSEPKLLAPGRPGEERPADPLTEAIMQADVIIGEPHPRLLYHQEDLPLKWLQTTWAGSDLYTRNARYTFPEGVMLTSVAGSAYGHTISQYVVGQILAVTQNLAAYARQQPTKAWNDLGPVMSLEGATVLVFGAGDIGSHIARRLSGFDVARIVGVCRDTSRAREGFYELISLPRSESYLPEADVVVGCIPDSSDTTGYFNYRRLKLMKPGSVLVNVGRGTFVDCDALERVLGEEHLRGAVVDVTNPEPLPIKHPLWRNPRCVLTPHISGGAFGHSDGTEERICQVVCDNLRRYVAGEELTHRVL